MGYTNNYKKAQKKRRNQYVSRRRLATVALRDRGGTVSDTHARLFKHLTNAVNSATKDFMDKKKKRPKGRPMLRGANGRIKVSARVIGKKDRHEKLKSGTSQQPINKGKGYSQSSTGTCVTHPHHKIPAWKIKRLKDYEHDVWQTVLLSKSSRTPTSDNLLNTFRYPIKAPEALDSEKVQSMIFTPYMSAYTGIHTTYYRNIDSNGTDIEHNTAQPLDVIQNKTDIERHNLPSSIEGSGQFEVGYVHEKADGGIIDAAATQSAGSLINNHAYYDQILKNVKLDLKFMSSRSFPVKISISLIRHISPVAPYFMGMDDKKQLLNNLDNRGLEWNNYKVEYCHEFTLPALRVNKPPPTKDVIKDIKTHFMITNSFNDNNTTQEMASAGLTQLGTGIRKASEQVADGFVSGMCYILIKYRKVGQPQQFTYTQTIRQVEHDAGPNASITLPVLSEESFDVPLANGGFVTGNDGTPFKTEQGNETKASFYVHGTIKYNWGFKKETEVVPSVMSQQKTDTHYNKTQSLNIDPTITGNNTYGIYTVSPSHQTRAN